MASRKQGEWPNANTNAILNFHQGRGEERRGMGRPTRCARYSFRDHSCTSRINYLTMPSQYPIIT